MFAGPQRTAYTFALTLSESEPRMSTTAPAGTITLKPRARLIRLIGQELISDEPVAVVELAKNAYDADAKRVVIRFEGSSFDKIERIIVADDGHGMTLETALTAWLEPGTTSKRHTRVSPGGRLYQGEKGIGRFASARLAKTLLLESKTESTSPGVMILLQWGAFDDNAYLEDIPISYETGTIADLTRGTRLTMEGLQRQWTEADFERLQQRLSRLLSPFDDVKDFVIELIVPGRPDMSGEVQAPELVLKPKYELKGGLSPVGAFTGKLLVDGKPHRTFENRKILGNGLVPGCGPFEVDIRAWDRDRDGLLPIADRMKTGVQEIRRTLNAFCGVSIYRDGFRVYPYGQEGNDWLTLDNRSRQNPVRSLANNQIVAAIRISRDTNPSLQDRSNREGMVLNEAHEELANWFTAILSLLEEERYALRPRQTKSDQVEPLFESLDISAAVKEARKELGDDHRVARMLANADQQVRTGVERVQEVFSRLLLSSGLGHMVDVVIHEIGSPLGKVTRQLGILEKELDEMLSAAHLKKISPMFVSMNGWLEQIHNLRQRLEPQTPAKRGRATSFDVRQEVEDTLELYSALIAKQGVEVTAKLPKSPLNVRMSRASLGQVLANLIDNALFWIGSHKGVGKGGELLVAVKSLDGGFTVTVSDDGPGVDEDDKARIFEPYFTHKPNGMGLGLYIARLVIEPYGKLLYVADGPLSGATFEARFERSVGL